MNNKLSCLSSECICLIAVDKQNYGFYVYLQIPLTETGVSTTFNNRWIAAIDFGTTFSGYAFGSREELENDPTKIFVPVWQDADGGHFSHKTPTTVLLDNERNFVSFGFDAETEYSELSENDEHEDYYYFCQFKMMLCYKFISSVRKNTSACLLDKIEKEQDISPFYLYT